MTSLARVGLAIVVLAFASCSCSGSDDDDAAGDRDAATDASLEADGGEDAAVDEPPVANAGPDQVVETRAHVVLDASDSRDPEGQALSFEWAQTEGPPVELTTGSEARAEFRAPPDAVELAFELTVSDGTATATDDVRVTVVQLGGPRASLELHPFLPRIALDDARAVAIRGDHALVADAVRGLVVFDVSTLPDVGPPVAEIAIEGRVAQCLAIDGDLAYVGGAGLDVFDVTDPAAPSHLGGVALDGVIADRIAAAGTRVYLGRSGGAPTELAIVDASDPAAPIQASLLEVRYLQGLAARDAWVWVSMITGIIGFDATDPAAPIEREVSPLEGALGLLPIPGTDLVVASCPRTTLFDAADPSDWLVLATASGCGSTLALSGSRLYLGAAYGGEDVARIGVVDVTADPALAESDESFHSERSGDIDVAGDWVLVAAGTAGVLLVDGSPEAPVSLGATVDLAGQTRQVAWADGYAVAVTSEPNTLQVVDPDAATVLGSAPLTPAFPQGLAVTGSRAYVAGDDGVRIFDLTDPATPEELGFAGEYATAVAVSGTTAFVGSYGDEGTVYDVSDPTAPASIGTWSTPVSEGVADLVVADTLLLVGDRNAFVVLDVAVPGAPAELLRLGVDTTANMVAAASGLGAYTDSGHDMFVLDLLARPPERVASYEPGGAYQDLAIRDGFVYATAGSGLHILDVADPGAPVRAGFFDGPGASLVSLASGERGLVVALEDQGVAFVDDVTAVAMSPDRVLVARADELPYDVAWTDRPAADEQISCWVTGGSCRIEDVDLLSGTATAIWSLPDEAGDLELAVAVGDARWFVVRRDRVRVE